MIDGLVNNASALYQTIAAIVANAIAAANAAAGAASESKMMWNLGSNMVAGLKGALEAGQADVARAMGGLIGNQGFGAPILALAGAGGRGDNGGTVYSETHFHYHEAEGIGANSRANLRQDFELLQLMERMNG